jgi:hypothetical protein
MLMRQAGFAPEATHSLPVGHLRRRRGKFLYMHRCDECGYSFIARSMRRNCYSGLIAYNLYHLFCYYIDSRSYQGYILEFHLE